MSREYNLTYASPRGCILHGKHINKLLNSGTLYVHNFWCQCMTFREYDTCLACNKISENIYDSKLTYWGLNIQYSTRYWVMFHIKQYNSQPMYILSNLEYTDKLHYCRETNHIGCIETAKRIKRY